MYLGFLRKLIYSLNFMETQSVEKELITYEIAFNISLCKIQSP